MPPKSKSAISGRTVDIGHLEREIQQDVAAYRRHTAEDGMKKRAIRASKDYDEFRNFVSVSQLKPTSGREVSSLFGAASGSPATGSSAGSTKIDGGQAAIGGFSDIVQRRKDASHPSKETVGKANSINPKIKAGARTTKSSRAAHDFLKLGRQHCKTAEDTLSFLSRIKDADGSFQDQLILQPGVICSEYFSTDIDSEVLGNIADALHLLMCMKESEDPAAIVNGYEDDSELGSSGVSQLLSSESNIVSFACGWLKALPTCGRFELGISFLTRDQRQKLKEVCDFLKKLDKTNMIVTSTCLQYDALLR